MISRSLTRPRNRRLLVPAVALAAMAAVALASWMLTGPNLVHANHGLPHGTILARGSFAAPTDVKIKSTLGGDFRVMHVKDSQQAIVQQVTIEPGAQTGWHSHYGPVFVVVVSGTMTLYQADDPTCTGESYSAGQAFVDPGQGNVHNARNDGDEGVVLYATYLDVPPSAAGPAIPGANPGTCTGF